MSIRGINEATKAAVKTDNEIDATEARQIVAEHGSAWQRSEVDAIQSLAGGRAPGGARISPAARQVFADALRPGGVGVKIAPEANVGSSILSGAAKGAGAGAVVGGGLFVKSLFIPGGAPMGVIAAGVTTVGGAIIGGVAGAITAQYD